MEATRDTPAPGVVVWQPRRGFRYAADVFWLVGFALEAGVPDHAADLGTGSGVAALLLGARGVPTVGFDARPEWAPLWARSLAESDVGGRVRLERRDVRDGIGGPYPLVVANPPYFAAGRGPAAPDAWKAAARTETTATLADFVRVAVGALTPDGRAVFVLPRDRETEIVPPPVGVLTRGARVGRRRVLVELRRDGEAAPFVSIDERDPRVARWYALARGLTARG